MSYSLSGYFIEACDCTVICPCWVDDDPVGGHCTGLIAWHIDTGVIDGTHVDDLTVVSVSTHSGNRRQGKNTLTAIYVDDHAEDDQFGVLSGAFSGRLGGPMGELAHVSGVVVGSERAHIAIDTEIAGAPKGQWTVTVSPSLAHDVQTVKAVGVPRVFDELKRQAGDAQPLTLKWTALSYELGVPTLDGKSEEVTAQSGTELMVNVGALPGGNLSVTQKSGMRGSFRYLFNDSTGTPS